MDNKGAAAVEPGGMAGADLDLQDQLDAVGARASPKHEVIWIRGHPERRSKTADNGIGTRKQSSTSTLKPRKLIRTLKILAGCTGTTGGNSDPVRAGKSGSRDEESKARSAPVTKQIKNRCEGLRTVEHLAQKTANKTLDTMREGLNEGQRLQQGTANACYRKN